MYDLIGLVNLAFNVLYLLVLVRVLMSWIPGLDPYHPIARFVVRVTDPIMEPFRRLIPPVGGLDISPIVVFLVIGIAKQLVIGVLLQAL